MCNFLSLIFEMILDELKVLDVINILLICFDFLIFLTLELYFEFHQHLLHETKLIFLFDCFF